MERGWVSMTWRGDLNDVESGRPQGRGEGGGTSVT